VQISYTSSRQAQNQRFSPQVAIGIPLIAIFAQAYIPLYLPFMRILDLPLMVTIFFAVARRSPVTGLLTGGVIGLLQDSLTHQDIGLFGIAKTIVGYLASSIGVRLDVENPGSRFLMTGFFYVLHQLIYHVVARGLANQTFGLRPIHLIVGALLNAVFAVPFFSLLDRFKQSA
jgi:rod shape-determining protein MreD